MSRRSSSRESATPVTPPASKRPRRGLTAEAKVKEEVSGNGVVSMPPPQASPVPKTPTRDNDSSLTTSSSETGQSEGTTTAPTGIKNSACDCSDKILAKLGELETQLSGFMERQEEMNASLAQQQSNITTAIIAGFSQQSQLASLASFLPSTTGGATTDSLMADTTPHIKTPGKWNLSGGGDTLSSSTPLRPVTTVEDGQVPQNVLDAYVAEKAHVGARLSEADAMAMAKLGFPLEVAVRAYKTGKASRYCILKSYLWQAVKLDCERGNLDYKDIICASKEGEGMEEYIERQPQVVRRAIKLSFYALRGYKNFPSMEGSMDSELFGKLMGACRHLREMGRKPTLFKAESDRSNLSANSGGGDLSQLSMAPPEGETSSFLPSSLAFDLDSLGVSAAAPEPDDEDRAVAFVREREHIGARLSEKDALDMSTLGFSLKTVRNAYKIGKASKYCILKSYLYQLTKPDYERGALDYKDIIGSPKEDEGMGEFIERQPDIMMRAVQMAFKALKSYPGFPSDDQHELYQRLIGALRHCRQNLPRNKVMGMGASAADLSLPSRSSPAFSSFPGVKDEERLTASPFGEGEDDDASQPAGSPDTLAREFVAQAPNIGADVPEEDAVEMSKLGFPLKRIILAYKFAKASRYCVLKSMLWQLLKTECEKGTLDYRDIIVNPREQESLESYLGRQPDIVMRGIKVAILALYHYPDFPSQNETELFSRIVQANRYIGKQGACKVYKGPSMNVFGSGANSVPTLVPLERGIAAATTLSASAGSRLRPDDLLSMVGGDGGSPLNGKSSLNGDDGSEEGGSEYGDLMDRIGREPTPMEKEALFIRNKAHVGADLSDEEAAEMSRMGFSLKLLSNAYKFAKSSRHCILKSYLWQVTKTEPGMDYRDVVVTPKEGHSVMQHVQRQPDVVIRATKLAFKAFQRYPDFANLADEEAVFAKLVPAYRYVRESSRHRSGVSAKAAGN